MEESKQADEGRTVEGLMPCPFCGGAMRIQSNRDTHKLYGDHNELCLWGDDLDPVFIAPATDYALAALRETWNRRATKAQQGEPVAWRWSESGGWFDWTTDWTHYEQAKKLGYPIEYAIPEAPAAQAVRMLTVAPPEFQEASWGVNSIMRPCKSMAISEYAFRQWAKDVGIVLTDALPLEQQEGGK